MLNLSSLQDDIEILMLLPNVSKILSRWIWSCFLSLSLIGAYNLISIKMFSRIISVCTCREFRGFLISWDTVELIKAACCLSMDSWSINIFFEMSISWTIISGSFESVWPSISSGLSLSFMILIWKKQNAGWSISECWTLLFYAEITFLILSICLHVAMWRSNVNMS